MHAWKPKSVGTRGLPPKLTRLGVRYKRSPAQSHGVQQRHCGPSWELGRPPARARVGGQNAACSRNALARQCPSPCPVSDGSLARLLPCGREIKAGGKEAAKAKAEVATGKRESNGSTGECGCAARG